MITGMAFVAQPTRNLEAAKKFYGEVLGLAAGAVSPSGNWVEFTTPDGAVIALDGITPEMSDKASVFLALESDDIRADFARMKAAGATVAREPWTNTCPEGDVCHMAVLLDPDGNTVLLHQIAEGRGW